MVYFNNETTLSKEKEMKMIKKNTIMFQIEDTISKSTVILVLMCSALAQKIIKSLINY